MYIIERIDQKRGYVAPEGSDRTYVHDARHAKIFATREDAEKNRCPENEVLVRIFPTSTRGI
tara:strand:+ start:54 stop:239 length:186 start_codon:yes stop_codon:yes gene_type:complete